MLDVALLGTGGMMPLPHRFLTALMIRYKGEYVLFDCGEGTQVAIRTAGWGFKQIQAICFTHFHADHVAGLPGLLLTIGNAGRTQMLTIIGPAGVQRVVESLCVIAPELPFSIAYQEIDEARSSFDIGELSVCAMPVDHGIPCYAYKVEVERKGRFDVEKAKRLGLPKQYWSILQSGYPVEHGEKTYHPADVLGETRKGIRLCYATDLRPSSQVVEFVSKSDLFICEGNYGEPEKREKAILHRHCLFSEAAEMAQSAHVKELWLTHFSPSVQDPEKCLHYATEIFENTQVNKNRMTFVFDDQA